jgi:acetyltransferase-like isoleucine patch superfamily enzyme
MTQIEAEEVIIGEGVIIHETAIIRGVLGKAKRIEIGDHVYIGANVQIIVNEFKIGDYSKIQHNTNIHGYKPCKIGHNAWIGQYTIIDSIGGVTIGDNCGIGAHSQLWSHIKYGDTLEGCRFKSEKPLLVGNDVWFVGHCIVSPIEAKDKSLALAGSVITNDMLENHIYGGSPARDLTDKTGPQFVNKTNSEKLILFKEIYQSFITKNRILRPTIKIIESPKEIENPELTYFVIQDRKYTKRLTEEEVSFMKFILPDRAKFTPY